jgi:ribosomal-protein-alanine N-acetyltransferase
MAESTIRNLASPVLNSKRLILRPFVPEDAPDLFSWASDPEVTRFLRFSTHQDLSESERVIKRWILESANPPFFHWAIVCRDSMRAIGSIGVDIASLHDNRGEIGYCLARRFWNRGYATEALAAVLDHALETAGFHRVEACHAVGNEASGRVMRKAGMLFEAGPLRDYYRADQLGYQDAMMYVAFSERFG